jgi:hypothetical protein
MLFSKPRVLVAALHSSPELSVAVQADLKTFQTVKNTSGAASAVPDGHCYFYLNGAAGCLKGSACHFKHDQASFSHTVVPVLLSAPAMYTELFLREIWCVFLDAGLCQQLMWYVSRDTERKGEHDRAKDSAASVKCAATPCFTSTPLQTNISTCSVLFLSEIASSRSNR